MPPAKSTPAKFPSVLHDAKMSGGAAATGARVITSALFLENAYLITSHGLSLERESHHSHVTFHFAIITALRALAIDLFRF